MEYHTVEYKVLNNRDLTTDTVRHWEVDVHATPEELQTFVETGYLIREGLFQGEALQQLRDALDRLEEQDAEKRDKEIAGKRSWGYIPRRLMDKDKVFLDLLKFQPTLSIARAMMGPLVRLRGLSARIGYPGDDLQHQTPYGREGGGHITYNAAKAAEISMTKSLAKELAPDNIRVNSVAPGSILFPGGGWARRIAADPAAMEAFVKSDMPLGRFGKPEEIANVVVFLASERASLVTGACVNVDGCQSHSNI